MPGDGQAATTDLVPPVLATPELEAGTRLVERYRLIARLGRGGGGTVWRAFDEKVGEELALKLLEGGADLERWRREVALARRISHGNVCRVYDLGEALGLRWVTMERIEGDSLRAQLQRGAIAEPERLMRQLVDAVAAIHAAGVVHRDLKPENVVVDGAGRAVVVDFGLARRPVTAEPAGGGGGGGLSDDRTVTDHGAVLGTPRYMAPEQAAGEPADARSDVYALGLVLDEIARGRDGAAEATTVADGAPATRPPIGAALARPWGPVIARCTAVAAADRYPDAVAVRAALASQGRGRRRWAIGAAAVAVAAGALVVARSASRAPEPGPGPLVQRRLTTTAATPAGQPTSVAVSADGTTLAYTVGLGVLLRPLDGGRQVAATMPMTPGGLLLARQVEVVGFLGDGRVVAQILDRDHGWGLWALGVDQSPQPLFARDERMVAAVSPRGDQLAVATPSGGLVVVGLGRGLGGGQRRPHGSRTGAAQPAADASVAGAERLLVAPTAGERLAGLAWSPDAARIALVRQVAGGDATLEAVSVARPDDRARLARLPLAEPIDRMTAWPAGDRVVVVANDADGAALLAVPVAAAPAVPAALVRWPGEYVAELAPAGARLVVLRGSAGRTLDIGVTDRRGYVLNLMRGAPEHARAAQLAGWTADGRLVHAADAELVVRAPDGPAVVLAAGSPEAVVGDAVVYRRGRAIRAIGLGGGGDRALGELPAAPAGDLVRCAGDRAPPCVIADADRAAVRYLRFDPVTGARGDELYRAAIGPWLGHAMAVSPDGATLAVVDGTAAVTLVGLAGGAVRREPLSRSAEPVAVSWSHDGASLLVSVRNAGDDRAGVIRLWPGGARQLLLHSDVIRFGRIDEDPTGALVAIEVRELALDAWLIDGL